MLIAGCGGAPIAPSSDQTPPTLAGELERWLAAGSYKKWKCEAAPHAPRVGTAHEQQRICSNARLSGAAAGEYPIDSASVKELFDAAGTTLTGYAVSRRIAGGAGGDSWYWYERVGTTVYADGRGVGLCAGCHNLAGSDATHPGRDFVYTQVR